MTDPIQSLSIRLIAVTGFVFFLPVVIGFIVAPGAWSVNYAGILFHLTVFLLVAKLDAPDWAKAAGYGWVVLDVMTGVLTLNGVSPAIYGFIRLGGHIFGGVWIGVASLPGSRLTKTVGILTGAWLCGFTFASPFLPPLALAPSAFLLLAWLLIIAWENGARVEPHVRTGRAIPIT